MKTTIATIALIFALASVATADGAACGEGTEAATTGNFCVFTVGQMTVAAPGEYSPDPVAK